MIGSPLFKILSLVLSGLDELLIKDLHKPGCNEWDWELISSLFSVDDVLAIRQISCIVDGDVDRIILQFTKNGIYSVKSGY